MASSFVLRIGVALTTAAVPAALLGACSLFSSSTDLTGGTTDAGLADAPVVPVADADSGAPAFDAGGDGGCACPAGSVWTGKSCAVTTASTHRNCVAPIVVPACSLTYDMTLCAVDPPFAFDSTCINGARQAAFFELRDAPKDKWHITADGVDVVARTDVECTKGVPTCGKGPIVNGDFSENGTTVAIGKLIGADCTTISVTIAPLP